MATNEKKEKDVIPAAPNAIDLYGSSNVDDAASGGGESNVYDDAMAKALREQNYKSFFNTAIQQYNIKANSEKYLLNDMAARGLGTQGYGSTAASGIQNTALNMYSQNLDSYHDRELDITQGNLERAEQEKYEAEQKQIELDNQLVAFIQNAINYGADEEYINNYLVNYGYMEKDASGNYVYTEKWDNLSAESKAYITSVMSGADLVKDPNKDMPTYGTEYNYDQGEKIFGYDKDGNPVERKGAFNNENNHLNNAITKGEVKPGTYIALVNDKGERLYIYYGTDGKLYNMSHDEYYNNAKDDNAVYFKEKSSTMQSGVYNS